MKFFIWKMFMWQVTLIYFIIISQKIRLLFSVKSKSSLGFTGIVSSKIGLRPRNDPGFTFQDAKLDPCLSRRAFTWHHVTPIRMKEHYTLLSSLDVNSCKERTVTKEPESVLSNFLLSIFSNTKLNKTKKNVCY